VPNVTQKHFGKFAFLCPINALFEVELLYLNHDGVFIQGDDKTANLLNIH